jgi:hypothetical protein
MNSSFIKYISIIIFIAIIKVQSIYRHKIEPFSFDIRKFEYPLEYSKVGTAIALRKSIKLIPKVENRYGGVWLIPVSLYHYFIYFLYIAC